MLARGLGERLRAWQWEAIALGAVAIAVLTVAYGGCPKATPSATLTSGVMKWPSEASTTCPVIVAQMNDAQMNDAQLADVSTPTRVSSDSARGRRMIAPHPARRLGEQLTPINRTRPRQPREVAGRSHAVFSRTISR
ncbi:hypothetical protein ACBJ59_53825 [Nonomuraea sp. MTCD27]|uniref:hypothetical protein n=1 Tax=Nonomuraea sp. MTCD27 TaxID=1676747 RepID=UPI0035BF1970